MEIWMSSEKDVLVGKAEHTARHKVEPIVNQLLHKVELACGLERWSVIFIVMRDEWIGSYPEIKRYHKSKKMWNCVSNCHFSSLKMRMTLSR